MIEYFCKYWIEIFAVITGLLYVYLEIKQNKIMWIVGIISSLVFIFVFFSAKIYAQMGIYVYYVLISVYGYLKWNGKLKTAKPSTELIENGELKIKNQKSKILILVGISLILSVILAFALKKFTDSPIPFCDGLVAAFSVVATWMLTQKIIQHWYFWMGINLFCVPLYISQGLHFTAFMFLVYFIMSIIGLQQWKKK